MSAAHAWAREGEVRLGPRGLVFVSYCREDAEWLRRFEVMLKPEVRERGLELWSDTLIAPSRQWRPEIDAAIARADVALLLVSPDFLASDFVMDLELPALIAQGVPLVPVLVRACRWQPVRALASVQWGHDPGRDGPIAMAADVDGAIVRATNALMAVLDDRADPLYARTAAPSSEQRPEQPAAPALPATGSIGALDGVPEAPPGFVARDELDELRSLLLGAGAGGLAITGAALGLHGQGGIGKTVLAAALARDGLVRRSFPDGVYWVTLGESPDLVGAQIDLLGRLSAATEGVRSTLDGVRALAGAVADRRCLLVVDDVWSAAAAQAFDVTGPQGRVLYTTRDPGTLRDVRARVQRIEVLSEDAARGLLAGVAHTTVNELPDDVDRILAATGRVALALALVAAAVGRGGRAWRKVADELELAAGTFLQHPYANVFKAMGVAVTALDDEVAAAHQTLAVYPEDARVPVATIERLWAHLYELTGRQTRERLGRLAQRELISFDADAISLHDLQRDFLLLRAPNVRLLHHELLDAYRKLLPNSDSPWRALPTEEPYIRQHLLEHLIGAGDMNAVTTVGTDLGWLAIRAYNDGPHAAEVDVRRAATLAPDDRATGWVLMRITQWGYLLGGHERLGDLAATLWTRTTDPPDGVDRDALRKLLPSCALTPRWGLPDADPAVLRVLGSHGGSVRAVAFSPDGRTLASAADDGTVRLSDVASGAAERILEGHSDLIDTVVFSPDGQTLASASRDGTARLWDVVSGAARLVLEGHSARVRAVAFSPDGQTLASAGDDGTVRLWDVVSGAAGRVHEGHRRWVVAVAFSTDGRTVASAGAGGTVRLWDVVSGAVGRVLEGHPDLPTAVALSPDGHTVARASALSDGTVRLWDIVSGAAGRILEGHSDLVKTVVFSPDGRTLASAARDGTVRLWDVVSGAARLVLEGHSGRVTALAFSPDGQTLASAGDDGTVRLWDVISGAAGRVHEGHRRWVHAHAFSSGSVRAVAFSPDGQTLASAGDDGRVRLWDVVSGAAGRVLEGHLSSVRAVAFTPDGQTLASAGNDETVRFWDVDSGTERRVLKVHRGAVPAVAFSPDGHTLASAGFDGTVFLRDVASGATVRRVLAGHSGRVDAVVFSPDGQTLASAGVDRTVRLWDVVSGAAGRVHEGHRESVLTLAFSSDGQTLGSGGYDETVRLWDVVSGAADRVLEGHSGWVRAVAFSPDGQTLASASYDQTVRLWDTASATCSVSIRFGEPVTSIATAGNAVAIAFGRTVCYLLTTSRTGKSSAR